jgi:small GTP-binding protein
MLRRSFASLSTTAAKNHGSPTVLRNVNQQHFTRFQTTNHRFYSSTTETTTVAPQQQEKSAIEVVPQQKKEKRLFGDIKVSKSSTTPVPATSTSTSTETTEPTETTETTTTSEKPVTLFTKKEEEIVQSERALLSSLLESLSQIDADEEDIDLLKRSSAHLDDLFLVVIVGEFNSGKSSFINALLGDRYLKEGITPTTANLHLIRHGGNLKEEFDQKTNVVNLELPLKWLQGISVVDTPGTNAIIKSHQQITEHFVPRSDLIIFLTSAERPFSESEHTFMESIRKWGKKVIVCINKFDLLQNDEERKTVDSFVRNGISKLLGFDPTVFGVSARQAFNWKHDKQVESFMTTSLEDSLREVEQGGALSLNYDSVAVWKQMEAHILKTLSSIERIQLKLATPLGVAENLVNKYSADAIEARLKVLREDKKTVEIIEDQLQQFTKDMQKDFQLQQKRLDNILYEMQERGTVFFEEFLQFSNIQNLIKSSVVTEKFQDQVIGDVITQIEGHISEVIDWIIDRKYRQWKAVTDFVYKRARVSTSEERLVGSLKSDFNFNRKELLLSIGAAAEDVVESNDTHADTEKLYSEIYGGLKTTAAMSASAVGAGAATLFLAPTATAGIFGVVGAAAVVAASLYVLPYKRSKLRKEFVGNVDKLRQSLHQVMTDRFNYELQESVESIRSAISPYSRFVTVEYEKYSTQKKNLQEMTVAISAIRKSIEKLSEKENK